MAINPELITTIRVDQLPDETLSLTNLFPHTVGTDLKSATIQELVDLVATSIGVSGGVGYLAISVTDGQQLPDVPELPGFFLCGAGTYLNINGYPDVICTDELNAVMSLTDHWQLAVGIPIVAEVGVQSVTGSAVDNTDPLNPVINEIIFGVQNIIPGTNIDVDDTDPANPIISVIGGGGTQDLQEVTDEGNTTTNAIKAYQLVTQTNGSTKSMTLSSNNVNSELTAEWQDKNYTGIADITDIPTLVAGTNITIDDTDPLNPIISATGGGGTQTLAQTLDLGNTTGGENISISNGDAIILDNGANLKKGTTDAGLGGTKGIALRCAVDYELKWEAGRLYVMGGDGFTIREVSHNFTTTPTVTDDDTKGFVIDSRWILDNGDVYLCNDDTTGAADWELVSSGITTLQNILDFNHDLVNGNNFQGTTAGLGATGSNINAFGTNAALNNNGSSLNALGNTSGNNNSGNNVNAFGDSAGYVNTFSHVNLFGNNATADENGQTVLSKDGTIMARISTTDLTATRKYTLQDGDGTLAFLSDITGGGGGGISHATASGTDTYTATITGVTAYSDADAYLIRFTNGNTTGATLNINSLGAKTLYRNNDGALIGGDIINGGEMLCIYNTSLNGFQLIGTAPNSLFAYVTNADSVTITKGMPVYAFGGQGDRMTVKRANNSADATSAQTVGLVLSTSIAAGQKGLIMMQGLLDGLSILPTATWNDGDPVYLGSTAGTITNVKPHAPNHLVYLGVVTTASNGSAGRMYVRVQNGFELSEIHDIDLITNAPTNNQVLTYESSTDLWKNKSLGTILGYTPYKNIQTSQTAHTGTTAETNIFTATIPGGVYNSNDIIKVLFGINKTTLLAGYILRLRLSTTNTPLTGTLIGYFSGGTGTQSAIMTRNFSLNGGNLYGVSFPTTIITDQVATNVLSSTALNPANQFYIHANISLANAGDSIIGTMLSIHN